MSSQSKSIETKIFPSWVAGDTPIAGGALLARWQFIKALQIERPDFWKELRELESQEAIASWMFRSGITDDWLIQVILDTVDYWNTYPESPAARLESGRNWFRYRVIDDYGTEKGTFQFPPFQPWFVHPDRKDIHPIPFTDDGKFEDLEHFRRRMQREFDEQLSEYLKYCRDVLASARHEQQKHAVWTARIFTGDSAMEIGKTWPGLKSSIRPDRVVKEAVHRFAAMIGLTLR